MEKSKALEFIFSVAFGAFDLWNWIVPVVVFLASFFLVGSVWGMAWNRSWGLSNHIGSMLLSLVIASLLALCAIGYQTAAVMPAWLDARRQELSSSLPKLGELNRAILRDAWSKLQEKQSTSDNLRPDEGGQEVQVFNEEELRSYAESAAQATKKQLSKLAPFSMGLPLRSGAAENAAVSVVQEADSVAYPLTLPSGNSWSALAVRQQIDAAFESVKTAVNKRMAEWQAIFFGIGIVLLLGQLALVASSACKDIQENPKI